MSVRNEVLEAFVAAHEVAQVTGGAATVTKPAGLVVHRFRQTPIDNDTLPAMVIYFMSNDPELSHIDRNLNTLQVAVEHRIEVAEGAILDDVMDPLLVWSHRCIKSDETLGGLVHQIREGETTWDGEVMDAGYAAARVIWTVDLFTAENDPRQQ
jgi:hypothetical protein